MYSIYEYNEYNDLNVFQTPFTNFRLELIEDTNFVRSQKNTRKT